MPTLLRDCLHCLLNSPTPFDRCQTVNGNHTLPQTLNHTWLRLHRRPRPFPRISPRVGTKVGPVCRRSPCVHPEPEADVEAADKRTPLLVLAPARVERPPLLVPPPLPLPPPREVEPPLPPPPLRPLPLPPSPAQYFLAGECEYAHAFPKLHLSGLDHA